MKTRPQDAKFVPKLRYLRKPHDCNYCHGVNGMTFEIPGRFKRRLLWVKCKCKRKHYVCPPCAGRIGSVNVNGVRLIAACAKGFGQATVAAGSGKKGGR